MKGNENLSRHQNKDRSILEIAKDRAEPQTLIYGNQCKAPTVRPSYSFKDIHVEKTSSIKNQALTKSMNMNIWIIGTSNQLLVRGSYNQIKFWRKQST